MEINWAVIAPLLVIDGLLILLALLDCFKQTKLNGPRWLWVLIILFVTTIGPIIYFIFGRRNAD